MHLPVVTCETSDLVNNFPDMENNLTIHDDMRDANSVIFGKHVSIILMPPQLFFRVAKRLCDVSRIS